MQYELLARQWHLEDSIRELDSVNNKIAELAIRKKELTDQVIAYIGHEYEGQRSYDYDDWKIEIKTPCVYALNKKLYETGEYALPPEFNPIKQSLSYTIDKKLFDEYSRYAPDDVKDMLVLLIDKKPGKKSVSIRNLENV